MNNLRKLDLLLLNADPGQVITRVNQIINALNDDKGCQCDCVAIRSIKPRRRKIKPDTIE